MSDTPGSIAAPRALAHAPPARVAPVHPRGPGLPYESSRSCRWRGGMRRSPIRGWRVQWREAHRPHCRGSASARISYGLLSTMPSAIRAAWRARAAGRSAGSISANWLTRIESIQPRRLNLIMWVPLSPGWDDAYMRKPCQRTCRRREGTRALGNDPTSPFKCPAMGARVHNFPDNSGQSKEVGAADGGSAPRCAHPRQAAAISPFCEPKQVRIDGRGRDEAFESGARTKLERGLPQPAIHFVRRCLTKRMTANAHGSDRDRDAIATSLAHSVLTSHKQT